MGFWIATGCWATATVLTVVGPLDGKHRAAFTYYSILTYATIWVAARLGAL